MFKLPSPAEFGLPEKFDSWRPAQEGMLDILLHSNKRIDTICAPTGSGKSPGVIAYALHSGKPTCIVTGTRGLQDQYLDDFASIGLVDLRGRANYPCGSKPGRTCEDGYAANCAFKGSVACASTKAELRAASSMLVVTNYAKWITSGMGLNSGLSHIEQVIFDEAHNAPNALAQALQITLNQEHVEEELKCKLPEKCDWEDMEAWKSWASVQRVAAEAEMMIQHEKIQAAHDPKQAWIRRWLFLRSLFKKLSTLALCRPGDWVVDEVPGGYQFDPIFPGRYAESNLLFHKKKIIMVSATVRPKTMFMCGLGRHQFSFTELDSDFDPRRCPIYYVPTMRVDKRNSNRMELLWIRLDQIAARRRDRKGIVHTVSFTRQQEIKQFSRFFDSMIINEKGEPATSTVRDFKESGPGTILVSPSVPEGYDFPDDQCRWQFVCKIPFEPPSRIVKARESADPEYRAYQAIQTLVQAFGRGMRNRKDWCENFIGDDHLEWFLPRYRHLAPRSFHGFFKRVSILPQPPTLGHFNTLV